MTVQAPAYIVQILRELALPDGPLERADSDSNEVWIGPAHVVRFHGLGPPGRLAHEALVAKRLPAEVLHPTVIASGWVDDHDWLVLERAAGESLSVVWPTLSDEQREQAITDFGVALRHVHAVDPDGLDPPACVGGLPFIRRDDTVSETLRFLGDVDGDRLLLDGVIELTSELAAFVDDPPRNLVHDDLNFNNILWDGRVTALLDFEWARPDARDVDLMSIVAFCDDAVVCVPESVAAVTTAEMYAPVPIWLHEAYPELFSHDRVRERVTFYGIVRWAQGLHHPEPGYRRLAMQKLRYIVDGEGPARLLPI